MASKSRWKARINHGRFILTYGKIKVLIWSLVMSEGLPTELWGRLGQETFGER